MKKIFITLMMVLMGLGAGAQTNKRVAFYIDKPQYKKAATLNKIAGFASLMSSDKQTSIGIENKSYFPTVAQAIQSAGHNVYRLNVQQDSIVPATPPAGSYALYSTVGNLMSYTGSPCGLRADVTLEVRDLSTRKIVATYSFTPSTVGEVSELAAGVDMLAGKVTKKANSFLWNVLPIEGTVVQKGVEHDNGKTKEKECYIDLAEQYGVTKGMKLGVYEGTVDKKHRIGTLKISEVQGDELSVCSITKGAAKIEKLLENGVTVIVSTFNGDFE